MGTCTSRFFVYSVSVAAAAGVAAQHSRFQFSSTSTSASILCPVAHELRCWRYLRESPIAVRCALYGRRPLPCAFHALAHFCTSTLEALDCIYTIALWPRRRLTQARRSATSPCLPPLLSSSLPSPAPAGATTTKDKKKNSIASSPILPCSAVWGAGISCVG